MTDSFTSDECAECKKISETRRQSLHHTCQPEKTLFCDLCNGKIFNSIESLRSHLRIHAAVLFGEPEPVPILKENKLPSRKINSRRLSKIEQNQLQKPEKSSQKTPKNEPKIPKKEPKSLSQIICKICSESFTLRIAYLKHLKTHKNNVLTKNTSEEVHRCKECKRNFAKKHYLTMHMRVHKK